MVYGQGFRNGPDGTSAAHWARVSDVSSVTVHAAPRRSVGNATSHSWTLDSPPLAGTPPLLASIVPAGLNAPRASEVSTGGSASPTCCWVATSHSRSVPSSLLVARISPSGVNATAFT